MKRREVITQTYSGCYMAQKNAPRCILFRALTIISFIQFFGFSTRTFVDTLFRKKSENMSFFKILSMKKIVKISFFLLVFDTFSSTKTQNYH